MNSVRRPPWKRACLSWKRAPASEPWKPSTESNFRAMPDVMFSADGYHPSATAYALAADALLAAICDALGEKVERPLVALPAPSAAPTPDRRQTRHSMISKMRRRPISGVGGPSSCRQVVTD